MPNNPRMTRLLADACAILPSAIESALRAAGSEGASVGRILARTGIADAESRVAQALATSLRTQLVSLAGLTPAADAPTLPLDRCRRWRALPVGLSGRNLRLAMVDPLDYAVIQDIEFATGLRVHPIVTTETDLLQALDARESADREAARDFDRIAHLDPEGIAETSEEAGVSVLDLNQAERDASLAPVVRLVNALLSDAARAGASDVHVEPQEATLLVRQRVDGMLHDTMRIPRHLQDAVISRLKILAGMDIAERRKPQDGRSKLLFEGKRLDLRLSTLPAQFGEKVVVRLLDSSSVVHRLENASLVGENLPRFRRLISRPQGLVLVTGPTGSGKTTTLHAALHEIWSPTKNIVTLEDPVEYRMAGINQVQVNPRAGVTFASGLRSILRQDPNVVLVGEIREHETGAIALEAAQTGHLLLSTLHANDSAGSIVRLIDLGVEPFLVASSLAGILAQRLVRVPCANCAVLEAPSPEVLEALDGRAVLPPDGQWVHVTGCEACQRTGYRGRVGIHELLVVDDLVREAIAARASEGVVRDIARAAGMTSLMEDGIAKAARGLTTLEEVLRVSPLDAGVQPQAHHERSRESAHSEGGVTIDGLFAVASPRDITVLVVDDSPVELTVVRYFLEAEGYTVITATDGTQGLADARRHHPDVIVSDVDMPGMGGLDFVRHVREDAAMRSVAIILLTSDGREATELSGLTLGADDFLTKPVNPNLLKAHLSAVLARVAMRAKATA